MQQIINYVIEVLKAIINTCVNNELLSWSIYLFVFFIIILIFSNLWRK